jgi:hypothetical protein
MLLGFGLLVDEFTDTSSQNYPARPDFDPLPNNEAREALFGKFEYIHKPLPNNPENIEITDDWVSENIVKVTIPQITNIKKNGVVYFHKLAQHQLKAFFIELERENLLHYLLTWDGDFNARFIRGSKTNLSCHAFGMAIDVNYSWNKLRTVPALVGQKGTIRPLVEIANKYGLFWGGHFKNPLDGMHFEVAKIM